MPDFSCKQEDKVGVAAEGQVDIHDILKYDNNKDV